MNALNVMWRKFNPWFVHQRKYIIAIWWIFDSTTLVTRVSSDNVNIAAEHQKTAEVLSQLGDMSTPQFTGSKIVASVVASGVPVAASGVVCDSSIFPLEIIVSTKLLTSDGAQTKTSVSLINYVALVGQQHEVFSLQGRVVDVAHVGQAHPCHKSHCRISPWRELT